MTTLRLGLIQLNAREDKAANLAAIADLLNQAADRGTRLAALPEYCTYMGPRSGYADAAEPIPGPFTDLLAEQAVRHDMWILSGSSLESGPRAGKFYNTSVLVDPSGRIAARYRKIHLYDVAVGDAVNFQESALIEAGAEVVTADVDGHRVGLSICYDLRFPELYRRLADQGAELLFVPSAFMLYTGKDHWHVLLRARAIENVCYVAAPSQIGRSRPDVWCYGRSVLIDPWGLVVAEQPDEPGVLIGEVDFARVAKLRQQIPSLQNRRLDRPTAMVR